MSDNRYFNRHVILEVFDRQEVENANGNILEGVNNQGTKFSSIMPNGTPGFRITAKVEKFSGPTPVPNLSAISIYNLGPESRAIFKKTNNLIVLSAGYGTNTNVLFAGNISWAKTQKQGPDYVTQINAGDGLFAFQNSLINTSFGKGVSNAQVFRSLTDQLSKAGVGVEKIDIPDGGYNSGLVLSGSVIDRMLDITEKHNLTFSIQDGNVVVIPYGASRDNDPFVYTSEPDNNGLVGIPEIMDVGHAPISNIAAPLSQSERPRISFKVLLNPKIGPLHNVILQSKFVNGAFITTKVTHELDSWSGPYYTSCEAFMPDSAQLRTG